jgi:predicted Na+-dependent transporter
VGLACQFVLLPFITFLTVKAFALEQVRVGWCLDSLAPLVIFLK